MLLSGTTLVLNYPLRFLNHFLSLTGPIKLGSSNKGERQRRKEHWKPVFCGGALSDCRRCTRLKKHQGTTRWTTQAFFFFVPWVDGSSVGKDGEVEGRQMNEGDGGRCDRRHACCQLRREWRVFKQQLVSLRGKTRSLQIRPSPRNIYGLIPHRFLATFFFFFFAVFHRGSGWCGRPAALTLADQ